jgi:hypothetical protein
VEDAVVTICIAVSRAEIVEENDTGPERRSTRTIEGGQNVNASRMLGTSPRLRYGVIGNRIKVFKFCLLNACKREY